MTKHDDKQVEPGAAQVLVAKPKVTPLPAMQLAILCVVLLTESICSTVLIPFVAFYVAFMKDWSINEAGYASGFLVGLFMLGQVISGKIWGIVSDKYGRKIAIECGVAGCSVAMLFFGIGPTLWLVCFWRFIHGLFAGCSLVAKTMIADVTDSTNQAKGYALVSLTWGVGTLIGPSIGGFLYDPGSSDSLAFLGITPDSFIGRHPAFLPCVVVSSYCAFTFVWGLCLLQETNKNMRPLSDAVPACLANKIGPCLNAIQPKLPGQKAKDVAIENLDAGREAGTGRAPHPAPSVSEARVKLPPFGFRQAFEMKMTRNICIMSMLISASDMMYAEIFPLWTAVDHSSGGLSLLPRATSILVLVNSIPAVGSNLCFAHVCGWFGDVMQFWRFSQFFYAVFSVLIPFAPLFGLRNSYWYTMAINMTRKIVESWTFAILMMVVAQSAPPGRVGIMYGVQQSTACLVRCAVPFIFAPIFAWSVNTPHPFPFNHYLVFFLTAIPLMISIGVSYTFVFKPTVVAAPGTQDAAEQALPGTAQVAIAMATDADETASRNESFFRSLHSFAAAVPASHAGSIAEGTEPTLLLNNSFATLANSFATNMVGGLLAPALIPFDDSAYVAPATVANRYITAAADPAGGDQASADSRDGEDDVSEDFQMDEDDFLPAVVRADSDMEVSTAAVQALTGSLSLSSVPPPFSPTTSRARVELLEREDERHPVTESDEEQLP